MRLLVLTAVLLAAPTLANPMQGEPRLSPGSTDALADDALADDALADDALADDARSGDSRSDGAPSPDAPRLTPTPPSPWLVPTLHTVGVLTGMRVSLSVLWPEHFDPSRLRESAAQFKTSWSQPPNFRSDRTLIESDGDPWVLNTVGHGLFGAEVYLRFRQCGHFPLTSAAATGIASTFWEYGPEAFHKQPSAIDLLWTPIVGSLIGEGRFQLYRAIRGSELDAPGGGRGALLFLVDPFGEAERRLLGTGC